MIINVTKWCCRISSVTQKQNKNNEKSYLVFLVFLSFESRKIDPNPDGDGPPITGVIRKLPPLLLQLFFPDCFCGLNWYELQQEEGGQDEGSGCGRGAPPCLSELCLSTSLSIALLEFITDPVEMLLVKRGKEQIRLFFISQLRLELLLKLQNDFDDVSTTGVSFWQYFLDCCGDGNGRGGGGGGGIEETIGGSSYL